MGEGSQTGTPARRAPVQPKPPPAVERGRRLVLGEHMAQRRENDCAVCSPSDTLHLRASSLHARHYTSSASRPLAAGCSPPASPPTQADASPCRSLSQYCPSLRSSRRLSRDDPACDNAPISVRHSGSCSMGSACRERWGCRKKQHRGPPSACIEHTRPAVSPSPAARAPLIRLLSARPVRHAAKRLGLHYARSWAHLSISTDTKGCGATRHYTRPGSPFASRPQPGPKRYNGILFSM